jgi:hypothetical protein
LFIISFRCLLWYQYPFIIFFLIVPIQGNQQVAVPLATRQMVTPQMISQSQVPRPQMIGQPQVPAAQVNSQSQVN